MAHHSNTQPLKKRGYNGGICLQDKNFARKKKGNFETPTNLGYLSVAKSPIGFCHY